jgi:hypothetical protein
MDDVVASNQSQYDVWCVINTLNSISKPQAYGFTIFWINSFERKGEKATL